MFLLRYLYLFSRKVFRISNGIYSYICTYLLFKIFRVRFKDFKTNGVPILDIYDGATLEIGEKFRMNNGKYYNMIGRQQNCYFVASNGGKIKIGKNVGMSCSAIHCNLLVDIGDNVIIGGNCVIYDTDFHSLNFDDRVTGNEPMSKVVTKEVIIKQNAFIGAHTTVLKGVVIGENSIIGASSVVSKSIPDNEIWAGNPIRFIKKIAI